MANVPGSQLKKAWAWAKKVAMLCFEVGISVNLRLRKKASVIVLFDQCVTAALQLVEDKLKEDIGDV